MENGSLEIDMDKYILLGGNGVGWGRNRSTAGMSPQVMRRLVNKVAQWRVR